MKIGYKKIKRIGVFLLSTVILVAGLFIGDYIIARQSPIVIYPIKAHRLIWEYSGHECREAFCVYNYRWKNKKEIRDSILSYDARTINKDTVRKYSKSYHRTFFMNSGGIDKDYNNRQDRDGLYYMDDYILLLIDRGNLRQDKMEVNIYTNTGKDYYYSVRLRDSASWNKILNLKLLTINDLNPVLN